MSTKRITRALLILLGIFGTFYFAHLLAWSVLIDYRTRRKQEQSRRFQPADTSASLGHYALLHPDGQGKKLLVIVDNDKKSVQAYRNTNGTIATVKLLPDDAFLAVVQQKFDPSLAPVGIRSTVHKCQIATKRCRRLFEMRGGIASLYELKDGTIVYAASPFVMAEDALTGRRYPTFRNFDFFSFNDWDGISRRSDF